MIRSAKLAVSAAALAVLMPVTTMSAPAGAKPGFFTLAASTSTEQSGLLSYVLPEFRRKTGVEVRFVAVGTEQGLEMGKRGEVDVVLTHDPYAEKKFVDEGFGVSYRRVMYNDFVLVGPKSDPARARGPDVVAAFRRIFDNRARFVSRGDRSGVHVAELRLWSYADRNPPAGPDSWYTEARSGAGVTLKQAVKSSAYSLCDRGSWLTFAQRGELVILVEGDSRLLNQYSVALINPEKHPKVKKVLGLSFIDWLTSDEGQRVIASYRIGGEQAFFPNAVR